jgi:PAS domain S-box-containing protein
MTGAVAAIAAPAGLPLIAVTLLVAFWVYRARLVNRLAGIEEQTTRLSDHVANSPDGIFVVSPAGEIRSWNPAMEHITGWASARVVGRTWEDVFGRRGAPEHDRGDGPELEPGGDIPVVRPDGVERLLRYRRGPIGGRGGRPEAEVVVARDVTSARESNRTRR